MAINKEVLFEALKFFRLIKDPNTVDFSSVAMFDQSVFVKGGRENKGSEFFSWMEFDLFDYCGCGNPYAIMILVCQILHAFADDESWGKIVPRSEIEKVYPFMADEGPAFEFILHTLDKMELIDHGSSIFGSSLTESGEHLFEMAKAYSELCVNDSLAAPGTRVVFYEGVYNPELKKTVMQQIEAVIAKEPSKRLFSVKVVREGFEATEDICLEQLTKKA